MSLLAKIQKIDFGTSNRRKNQYEQYWQHSWHVSGLWDAYGAPACRSRHLSSFSGSSGAMSGQPPWVAYNYEPKSMDFQGFSGFSEIMFFSPKIKSPNRFGKGSRAPRACLRIRKRLPDTPGTFDWRLKRRGVTRRCAQFYTFHQKREISRNIVIF